MDILKAFLLVDTEYPINILGTLVDPLFQTTQIGKLLGISNVRDSTRDFDETEKVIGLVNTLKGQQECTFLTENGLYRLLGRSKKPVAYKFQKWMVLVLKEIRINGIFQLNTDKNEINSVLLKNQYDLKTHKALLKAYDKKNIVYICKFYHIENKFVIKIGSTQDIKERIGNIANSFNCQEPLLLDVFESNNYKKLERQIHHHPFISTHYKNILKKDGTTSRETYVVTDEIYIEFINTINAIKQECTSPNDTHIEELKITHCERQITLSALKVQQMHLAAEMKTQELEIKKIDLELAKLIPVNLSSPAPDFNTKENEQNSTETSDDNDSIPEEELLPEPTYIKRRKLGTNTPVVYQYNPENLTTPSRMFDSPVDVERSLKNISPAALKRAAKENFIYKGFRWIYGCRTNVPPVFIKDTVPSKHASPDIRIIAMIDIKRTKILATYSSQKQAVEARNMKCNSFTRAIQQQTISSGHYWNFFDNCSIEMQTHYLETNTLPAKPANVSGIKIQKIDPITNTVISVYNTKREIVKKYQISYAKLNLLLENSCEIYNGFIWKLI